MTIELETYWKFPVDGANGVFRVIDGPPKDGHIYVIIAYGNGSLLVDQWDIRAFSYMIPATKEEWLENFEPNKKWFNLVCTCTS